MSEIRKEKIRLFKKKVYLRMINGFAEIRRFAPKVFQCNQ